MTRILFLFCLVIPSCLLITSRFPLIHRCQVESYNETINIRNCSNTSLSIKSTRCRGQCYSEDMLIYDWQYFPKYYRHKYSLHCCTPNKTIPHQTQILCQNKQFQTINYRIITECQCKTCTAKCFE